MILTPLETTQSSSAADNGRKRTTAGTINPFYFVVYTKRCKNTSATPLCGPLAIW